MLPDISGNDVCRSLRASEATRAVPVIMLTARGEEIDRVVGFEVGADDYVVKPLSVRELTLRIKAVLRRQESTPQAAGLSTFGRLEIDREGKRVLVDGEERPVTALEFRFLETLLDRKGRVQTRETLLADVWGVSPDITTRTVDTHVKRLREKLGAAGAYVETVRGFGYRFKTTPDEG
jgi:two-component system phosphate regulon response regulator PhoB